MDDASVLLTIYSLVAGLGIAKLLEGVGMMIEARGRIRTYWMHSAWLAIIFAAHLVTFFALMRFAREQHWTVLGQILILGVPALLYLTSRLVVPPLDVDSNVDLKDYFYRNCHWFQGMLLGAALCAMTGELAMTHGIDRSAGGVLRTSAFLILGLGMLSRRPWVLGIQTVLLIGIVVAAGVAVSILLM